MDKQDPREMLLNKKSRWITTLARKGPKPFRADGSVDILMVAIVLP